MRLIFAAVACVLVAIGCSGRPHAAGRAEDEIRALIPEAASSPLEDWVEISFDEFTARKTFANLDSFPLSRALMIYLFCQAEELKEDFTIEEAAFSGGQLLMADIEAAAKTPERGYGMPRRKPHQSATMRRLYTMANNISSRHWAQ